MSFANFGNRKNGKNGKSRKSKKRQSPQMEMMESRQLMAVFTVNSATDVIAADANITLREAIIAANAAAGPDTINFNIPGAGPFTIQPTLANGPLPNITDAVTIDGFSQPGASANTLAVGDNSVHQIILNGTLLGNNVAGTIGTNGLVINASNSTVRGLVINGFDNDQFPSFGILITAGGGRDANNNVVSGNFIGTDVTGKIAVSNEQGVAVRAISPSFAVAGNANNNRIGGPAAADRNVISGNRALETAATTNRAAVSIGSPGAGLVNNNIIQNNYIGLDATGLAVLPNVFTGIRLQGQAVGTIIQDNVVSGNTKGAVNQTGIANGIQLVDLVTNSRIIGNKIGTDVNGTINATFGNADNGILLNDLTGSPANNTIGGAAAGQGNLIADNNGAGIFLTGVGVNGNVIQGNNIRNNFFRGIRINNGASNNLIGGANPGEGNSISQNFLQGINIEARSNGNTISRNSIFDHQLLGIDLLPAEGPGVLPGAGNNAQVAPFLDPNPTVLPNGLVRVTGTYNGPVPAVLEFFSNRNTDPSGFGEGETFLTAITVVAPGAFSVDLAIPVTANNRFITATATNTATGDTSEFSITRQVPVLVRIDNAIPQLEGDPGATTQKLAFTVRLNTPFHDGVTLNYTTQGINFTTADPLLGIAQNSVDYLNTSGSLTFAPGEDVKTIYVDIVGDLTAELDELVALRITDPSAGVTILQQDGVTPEPDNQTEAFGLILDDDLTFSINDVTALEGNAGVTPFAFTITANGPHSRPVTASYLTADGTALAGSDYTAIPQTVLANFAPTAAASASQNVTVNVTGDLIPEANEDFFVNLLNPIYAPVAAVNPVSITVTPSDPTFPPVTTVNPFPASSANPAKLSDKSQGVGTILNDDVNGVGVSITDVTRVESPPGAVAPFTLMEFEVSLTAPSDVTITVPYTTANGTAIAGTDYVANNGTLTFLPGETKKLIQVIVIDDSVVEPTEQYFVNLGTPTAGNAFLLKSQGVGTIIDNDSPDAGIFISDVTRTEGPNAIMEFEVSLTKSSFTPITVDFATQNGTATAGSDYTAGNGTITFLPGETVRRISVPLIDDTVVEPTENFFVNLSNAGAGSYIVKAQGVGTILDNEAQAILTATDLIVNEGAGTATFTLSLVSPNTGQPALAPFPITVQYTTAPGTATGGLDYTSVAGQAIIPAGASSITVTVPIIDDLLDEPEETFFLKLSGLVGPAVLGGTQAQATIIDNDALPVVAVGADVVAIEPVGPGDQVSAVFQISLSVPSNQPVTVNYFTTDGTAQANLDYQSTFGSVTFAPGEVQKEVRVAILRDQIRNEGDETFTLNLVTPTNATLGDAQAVGTILDTSGPQVVDLQRLGFHYTATSIVVTYDEPMDPASTTNINNYRLVSAGADGRFGTFDDQETQIAAVTLSADGTQVTISPVGKLKLGREYQLTINGTEPLGVRDVFGNLLDGDRDGVNGGNFVIRFNKNTGLRDLRRGTPGLGVPPVNPRPFGHPPLLKGVKVNQANKAAVGKANVNVNAKIQADAPAATVDTQDLTLAEAPATPQRVIRPSLNQFKRRG